MFDSIRAKSLQQFKPFISLKVVLLLSIGIIVTIFFLLVQDQFAILFIALLWSCAIATSLLSIRMQLLILWAILPFIDLLKRVVYSDSNASTLHVYLILITVDLIIFSALVKDFLGLLQKPFRINLTKVDYSVLLFGTFSLFSAMLVSNAPLIARLATTGMWVWPMVAYYLFAKYFNSKEHIRTLIKLTVILGIVVAIYGVKQFYFGFFPFELEWFLRAESSSNVSHLQAYYVKRGVFRTFGPMDSHSSYGIFLGIALISTWILRPFLRRNLWIIISILLTFGLFLSFTRFTYLMPAFSALFIIIFVYNRIRPVIDFRKLRRASWLLIGVVCSFFIFYIVMNLLYGNTFIPSFSNPYLQRVLGTGTLEARLSLDNFISTISWQNPLGSGLANSSFFARKFEFSSADVNYHNIFLDMIGSMGLISVTIFLSFMYFLFRHSLAIINFESNTQARRVLYGLFSLILAMLIVGHFNGAVFYFGRAIPVYFWAICGILAHYKLENPSEPVIQSIN